MRASVVVFTLAASALLSGCAGSSAPGPAVPTATTPALPQTLGDVRTVLRTSYSDAIAYDPDDKVLLVSAGGTVSAYSASKNAATPPFPPITVPAGIPFPFGRITGLAYSSPERAIYFADSTGLYRAAIGGSVTQVPGGFGRIDSLAIGNHGTLYILDAGHLSTLVSGNVVQLTPPGSLSDPSALTSAVEQMTYNSLDGALYVTDPAGRVIRRVTATGSLSVFAGSCVATTSSGLPPCATSNVPGVGSSARFGTPAGIAYNEATGMLYMSDSMNNELWKLAPDGTATIAAGYGAAANIDGNGLQAFLYDPLLLASVGGIVYIGQQTNGTGAAAATGYVISAYATTGSAPPPYTPPVQKFVAPSLTPGSSDIVAASDGTAWITEDTIGKVAHVTQSGISEYSLPSGFIGPSHIVIDASNNVWFGAPQFGGVIIGGAIIRLAPDGTQTPFLTQQTVGPPQGIGGLTIGPDGNPWFTVSDSSTGFVGYIDSKTGKLTQYPIATAVGFNLPTSGALVTGPDGNIWFSTYLGMNRSAPPAIGRMTVGGQLLPTQFPISQYANALALNSSDRSVAYVDRLNTAGKITAGGVESHTTLSQCALCMTLPGGVTASPDGSTWFTETSPEDVARIDPAGAITRYLLPQGLAGASGIASRADGKIWIVGTAGYVFLLDPQAYDQSHLPHSLPQSIARKLAAQSEGTNLFH